MKTGQSLEQKLKDAESKMPGISGLVQPYKGGFFDMYYSGRLDDAEYLETDKYQVLASKWEVHSWSDMGGGIAWDERLKIFYREKGKNEIKSLETPEVRTRDHHDEYRDRKDLMPYDYVFIKPVDASRFEVAWANKEGNKTERYWVNLDTNQVSTY